MSIPPEELGGLIQRLEDTTQQTMNSTVEHIHSQEGNYEELLSTIIDHLSTAILRLQRTLPGLDHDKIQQMQQQGAPKRQELRSKFISQIQLFNDKSQAVFREDEGLTSDEVLTSIAHKKSSILEGFLGRP